MSINVTAETDAIAQQFVKNREGTLMSLLTNPQDPYLSGQADALGIAYVQAAKLVAHGAATALRDLSMTLLKHRLEQEATTKEPAQA